MKTGIAMLLAIMGLGIISACDPGGPGNLSTREQAELIAATLSNDKGGVGQDISNIAQPATQASRAAQADSQVSLEVSVTMAFYDAEDQLQEGYNPQTTDRVDYESIIQGSFNTTDSFFQEFNIDNHTDFMATGLLSGTAVIDGSHSNHSAYNRTQLGTENETHFSLACDLVAIGVVVDIEAEDTFPEAGTIEGTVSGSYERITAFTQESRTLDFRFIAVYLGDNTAEIELNDGTVFIVRLDTGAVEGLEEG